MTTGCCIEKIRIWDNAKSPRKFLVTVMGKEIDLSAAELLSKTSFRLRTLEAVNQILDPPRDEDLHRLLAEAEHVR
jgi:hypothetical protein